MAASIDILCEIRRDFAELKGMIIHLQNLRRFSVEQEIAIEGARSTLSFIQTHYICNLRQEYGDDKWQRLEDIDKPKEKKRTGIHIKTILDEIYEKAQDINRKILNLPGENGCNDSQSAAVGILLDAVRSWRSIEMNKMLGTFQ